MDHLTKEKRSWNMSRIRSKNTKPEILVRCALHKMGYRFRLYGKVGKKYLKKGVLPGKPDIVLAKYKLVIFIHGCFWHRHNDCIEASIPKTNSEYWENKIMNNIKRDKKNIAALRELKWKVLIIWECELSNNIEENTLILEKLLND